ncbi:MAG: carboxypeptidase regulatory-like domain-containing protein [Pseudonocardiaceae bacterium]
MTTLMTATGHDLILRGVTFAYGPHAEPVLRNLDLTVPAGDHLAIVGPSGIGKSTLAGLLCGLLRPDAGTVRLGGAVAADLAPDRLAEIRTLIPQEAYVFASTVWDNLTYLCSTATTRQVDNAVAALGADELITRLGGIGAELAPDQLSAGERQLISLVRAYISAAPVVVLDEATCFLDPVAERRAEEAFADRDGTLIVIAHRVSSALRARRVLVLDGVSATMGDHVTLQTTSPLYRELLGHWQVGPATAHNAGVGTPALRPVLAGNGARRASAEDRAVELTGTEPLPRLAVAGSTPADHQSGPLIFGQVRSGQTPVPAATLTLTDLSGRQLDRDCADDGGNYRLAPPTSGSYLVICAAKGHQSAAALVAVAAAPRRHDVVFSGDGAGLSGTVSIAGTGQAVGNAVVSLVDGRGDVVAVVTTALDGRFAFAELAQGPYTLTVVAPSLPPVARNVEIPSTGQVSCDVDVAARGQLLGTVCTATAGTPVPEALATLVAADGHVVGSVLTGADGGFVFDDLDAGVYTVIATGYPSVATEVNLDAGAPTETVIALAPPGQGGHWVAESDPARFTGNSTGVYPGAGT